MDDNINKLIDTAYNYHVSGKYDEAKSMYEKILAIDASNADVLNLYAQLNVTLKNYDKALELFQKVYSQTFLEDIKINIVKVHMLKDDFLNAIEILESINNKTPQVLTLLSNAYIKNKEYEKAIDVYIKLNNIESNYINLFNIALCYSYLNKYNEALYYAQESLKLNNSDISVILQCANFSEQLGKIIDSINYLENALLIQPSAELYIKLGDLYLTIKNKDSALNMYKKALESEPKNKNAMIAIAFLYDDIDKNISKNLLKEVLMDYPDDKRVISYLYNLSHNSLNYDDMLKYAKMMTEADPNDYSSYLILAYVYYERYEFESSVKIYRQLLDMGLKFDSETLGSYISALYKAGYREEAVNKYKSSLNDSFIAENYFEMILKERDFKDIAEYYFISNIKVLNKKQIINTAKKFFYRLGVKDRFSIDETEFVKIKSASPVVAEIDTANIFLKKTLKNQNTKNSTVLIYSLQGAGDFLMMTRYFYLIKDKCKKLIIRVQDSFYSLYKYNFPDCEVIKQTDIIPEENYDYTTPSMNLIYNLGMDLYNIPYPEGYFKIDENLVNKMSNLKILQTNKIKVGLFWQGNPITLRNRSVPLNNFMPIINLDKIQIYSFQISDVDYESEQLKKTLPIIDVAPYIKNYEDTAAILKNIDVLITIDSSIAHLAGGLGIKTFLIIPHTSEWRWFYDTNTTPWYNSIKLFKQEKEFIWDDVIERIKQEIQNEWKI